MTLCTLGIDLGKTTFHVVGLDDAGRPALRRRLSRTQLLQFAANLPPCRIGMEACCGAHHIGRALLAHGHDVRLMPPQYVKPFVKTNKNDYLDAEAIAEAVQRPTMRFVPIKTEDQLDLQALHRVRNRLVSRRTSVINQLRAFLLERGITPRAGRAHLERHLPDILREAEQSLSLRLQHILHRLRDEWRAVDESLADVTKEIGSIAEHDEACQRLVTVPGVGTLTATAVVAAVGAGGAFRSGRDFAAWLGLVPRQHSTGGRPTLLGISKRGNSYLRRLLIHGARSVHRISNRSRLPLGAWLTALEQRAHPNVVTVALANKLARIMWAVLTRREAFRASAVASV
jgi:transposase